MPNYETHDIQVCTDCLMMMANGEVGDHGDAPEGATWADDNADTRHVAKMEAMWPSVDGWHMVPGDDDGEGFGWRRVVRVGSSLGGKTPRGPRDARGKGGRVMVAALLFTILSASPVACYVTTSHYLASQYAEQARRQAWADLQARWAAEGRPPIPPMPGHLELRRRPQMTSR